METETKAQLFPDCAYVSDELQYHLDKCIEHNHDLREAWWKVKDSPLREGHSLRDHVLDCAIQYSLITKFYMNGFNPMRAVYKDVDTSKLARDWFRPLVVSSVKRRRRLPIKDRSAVIAS
jgi:hypothetical protein